MGEFELIDRYFNRASQRRDVLLGIGDDAAVLAVPPGHRLVAAADSIVEGVHFPVDTAAADIGHRALAVNLSDLAAMGAQPAWALLCLTLPAAREAWLQEFAAGFLALAAQHDVALVGGDTTRGPLNVGVQALGFASGPVLTRAGGRPGDIVCVSGVPGEAAAGLDVILNAPSPGSDEVAAGRLRQRFLRPIPRVGLGLALRGRATAAIDVSDGVVADLAKLAQASRCAARLDLATLPRSADMQALYDAERCVRFSAAGGDDYELLFTVPPEALDALDSLQEGATPPGWTAIGQLVAPAPGRAAGTIDLHRAGETVEAAWLGSAGFEHFAAS